MYMCEGSRQYIKMFKNKYFKIAIRFEHLSVQEKNSKDWSNTQRITMSQWCHQEEIMNLKKEEKKWCHGCERGITYNCDAMTCECKNLCPVSMLLISNIKK